MSFVKKLAKNFLIGGVGKLLFGGGGKQRRLPRPVTRDDAREEIEADDELRRRRGAAADLITGTQGAEAAASSVGRLVVGS